MNVTKEINDLLENHGSDNIGILQNTNKIAAMVYQSFSDTFKEMNGYRPRHTMTVRDTLICIKNMQEEIDKEQEKDSVPINGVFFEGKAIKPIDWE